MRNLDNDYQSWRQERYKKFSDEFNTWRSSRSRRQPGPGSGLVRRRQLGLHQRRRERQQQQQLDLIDPSSK